MASNGSQSQTDPIIQLRGLRKRYERTEVIQGIDLAVNRGQVLGYIGPNGAGKTTTVKIMIGMLSDFEGHVSVCGYDVRTDSLAVKRHVGYIPESAALYDVLTPAEYLTFVGRLHGMPDDRIHNRSRDLLHLFDLESQFDQRISTFSKGMRQKVLIVGGLIHNPSIVVLDEPLSGLDANAALIIKELIKQLAEAGSTVFYCSHIMDVVERVCDRIVIINQGRIVADGSFDELRSRSQEASLEGIFAQLTSTGGHDEIAKQFLEIIQQDGPA